MALSFIDFAVAALLEEIKKSGKESYFHFLNCSDSDKELTRIVRRDFVSLLAGYAIITLYPMYINDLDEKYQEIVKGLKVALEACVAPTPLS